MNHLWARVKAAVALWLVVVLLAGFLDMFIRSEALEDLFFGSAIFHVLAVSFLFIVAPYLVKILGVTVDIETPPIDNRTSSNQRGALLGYSLIVTLLFLLTAALLAGLPSPGEPKQSSVGLLFISAMLVLLGVSFVAAYSHPEKTFFFRGLMWLSDQLHFPPRTRKFALFCAFMCFLAGIGSFLQYLGVL